MLATMTCLSLSIGSRPHPGHIFFQSQAAPAGRVLHFHDPALEHRGREMIVVHLDHWVAELPQGRARSCGRPAGARGFTLSWPFSMSTSADAVREMSVPTKRVEAILRPIFPFVTQRAAEDLDLRDAPIGI